MHGKQHEHGADAEFHFCLSSEQISFCKTQEDNILFCFCRILGAIERWIGNIAIIIFRQARYTVFVAAVKARLERFQILREIFLIIFIGVRGEGNPVLLSGTILTSDSLWPLLDSKYPVCSVLSCMPMCRSRKCRRYPSPSCMKALSFVPCS